MHAAALSLQYGSVFVGQAVKVFYSLIVTPWASHRKAMHTHSLLRHWPEAFLSVLPTPTNTGVHQADA